MSDRHGKISIGLAFSNQSLRTKIMSGSTKRSKNCLSNHLAAHIGREPLARYLGFADGNHDQHGRGDQDAEHTRPYNKRGVDEADELNPREGDPSQPPAKEYPRPWCICCAQVYNSHSQVLPLLFLLVLIKRLVIWCVSVLHN